MCKYVVEDVLDEVGGPQLVNGRSGFLLVSFHGFGLKRIAENLCFGDSQCVPAECSRF